MDCGAIRSLLKQTMLSAEQQARLATHLASCPACAGDADDAMGRLLRQVDLPPAHPPPTLTANIMARLPTASPVALYAREQQQRRWNELLSGLGLLGGSAVVLLVSLWERIASRSSAEIIAMWGGRATEVGGFLLRLTLVSKSILQGGTPLAFILLMLAVLLGVVSQRLPTPGLPRALVTAVIGLGLVVAVIVHYPTLDNTSPQMAQLHTVRAPITVNNGAPGDVLSLFGDIRLQGHIKGDVATLGGKVTLDPGTIIDGSVLSGAGMVRPTDARIAGGIVDGLDPVIALAQVAPMRSPDTQGGLKRLGGILGAFVTLLLAGLWLMLQPERLRPGSEQLRTIPLKALGLGLGAALVLGVLCLAIVMVLATTLIGTVLVPLVLVVAHVPFIRGIATVGQALGQRVGGTDEPVHGLWGIGIQAVIVMALALIAPLASLVTFYLLGSFGIGAALLVARRPYLSF